MESGKMCRGNLLSPSLWRRVYCGHVNDLSVPTHLKEVEAALFVAKHLMRSGNGGQRHLVLGDSMTLSCVFGKGRVCDSRLLTVARKWTCISIVDDLLLTYRWIPSDFNVVDTENDRETCDSKFVRISDFNAAFIESKYPPCRLINDTSSDGVRSRTPRRRGTGARVEEQRKVRFAGSCVGSSLRSTENNLTRTAVVPRVPISLRAPRLWMVQIDRVVKRVPGLSFLESNAVAPGTMDSYRRAVADCEAYATEIEQHLDWTSALEVEGICSPKASGRRLGFDS